MTVTRLAASAMRLVALILALSPLAALGLVCGGPGLRPRSLVSPSTASPPSPLRIVSASMRAGGDGEEEPWRIKVFSPENAGPWAILVVVIVFEGLAVLPRDQLPPLLQDLIPLVLGKQYAAPP